MAEILRLEGVEYLCNFPSSPLIDAAAELGIRPIVCRQERVGLGIADGYSRTNNGRRTGVFTMQSGPGSENAFPGLATAYADSSPVLVIPMGHSRDSTELHPNFDSRAAFAPITKSYQRVTAPDLLVGVMRRAFGQLRSGRPGPVVVEIPKDVGNEEIDGVGEYETVPRVRSQADPNDVDAAGRVLVEATTPVILAGQGVLYAEAWGELMQLADTLSIPVATTVGGKSGFPENHPLSLGTASLTVSAAALAHLRDADVVLAIGCSLTKGATLTANIPPGKCLIHITNDPNDLQKSFVTHRPLLGDAKLVLAQLIESVVASYVPTRNRSNIEQRIRSQRASWYKKWDALLASDVIPINPYRVVAELNRHLDPERTVLTHDAGSPRDQLVPFYDAIAPRSYLGWGKSHGLGAGVGFAIGARLAEPTKVCVHVMGDAAFGMTGLDLETAVRCNLPTLSIVLKNSTMASEVGTLVSSHERYRTRDLGGEYCEVARALGLYAEHVTDPNDVGAAIRRGREVVEGGQAALIEVVTNTETRFSNLGALR